jgi:hypothetical protein
MTIVGIKAKGNEVMKNTYEKVSQEASEYGINNC